MKKIIFVIIIIFNISFFAEASIKNKIINNFKKTENISFNFKQTIGEKTENGNCIIEYPKKIYCKYNNFKKKIIVSEIPYMVNKSLLLEEIARRVREKTINGISDLRDESDKDGMRIVIELKKDANDEIITNQLFKK